ncbi:MAG: triphosphoribosyl-dephospho-CoA synthase [Candidatus Bathyarchaeota archaeon]|nr:triphosphoribosyl-dephospho-CoA synthase [Candidatus Bathyarchaeota archaeon]
MTKLDKAKHISQCLQLAILLEVSAEKPGNVNLVSGFEGTRVEHFFASSIAAGPSFQEAANRGIAISQKTLEPSRAGLGELIRWGVADIDVWQHGGNTLLGTIMLFEPLAVAAGMTPMKVDGTFDLTVLRKNLDIAVRATTAEDSVYLYEAIDIANPSGLNGAPDLSVKDEDSKQRLIKENVSLFKVFDIAKSYDDICSEWVNNFPITFDLAYPYLMEQLKTKPLKTAIVHTFLKILSEKPDTFIARKVGKEKTKIFSLGAKAVLDAGGVDTDDGRKALAEFDCQLREGGNNYTPGTTADMTAATLALATLAGYRP